ncbi:MAG: right-handed parallel beta-helix repeat-containing protein [Chitinispirillaceae bacterium]|nr:right-handed parallel beta-helix repeat-containing protein [Chitinispirillaceae bacterium]
MVGKTGLYPAFTAGVNLALTTVLLIVASCNNNPSGPDNGGPVTISDCTLSGTKVYDSTGGPYTFTCNRLYVAGDVTIGPKAQVIITGYWDITGTLTIQAGANVRFGEGSYLWVHGGTLIINGNQDNPVVLKNSTAGKYWGPPDPAYGGITFDDNANAQSSITWCIVDSATNGITSDKDGLNISHSTVRNSKLNGIVFDQCGPKDSASFVNNTFTGIGTTLQYYPLVINAAFLVRLSGSGTFTGNTQQAIRVVSTGTSDYADESGTWRRHAVPYVFTDGYVAVGNTDGVAITIQPGTRLHFTEDAYLWVNKGKMVANGTATDSIFFRNAEAGKFWGSTDPSYGGITISSSANATSSFSYCVFDSAKNAVSIDRDKLSITYTTVRNAQHSGIIFYECGPVDSARFIGNSFIGNGSGSSDYPLVIDAATITRLPGGGSFSGNSQQAIRVVGQGSSNHVTETGTWRKHTVPYVFTDGYASIENPNGVTITVQPGTRCLFQQDSYIYVGQGTLTAVGTVADSIIFENQVDGQLWGWEGGLQFTEYTGTNSRVEYCRVSYAKDNGIFLHTIPVTVANCSIDHSEEYGVYAYRASANVNVASITFTANGSGPTLFED